jgi:hypothetical protein
MQLKKIENIIVGDHNSMDTLKNNLFIINDKKSFIDNLDPAV